MLSFYAMLCLLLRLPAKKKRKKKNNLKGKKLDYKLHTLALFSHQLSSGKEPYEAGANWMDILGSIRWSSECTTTVGPGPYCAYLLDKFKKLSVCISVHTPIYIEI